MINAARVTAAFEVGREERLDDLFGKTLSNDSRSHRQYVRIIVCTTQASGVQAIAQSGANTTHLVGGKLLTLPAPPEHDADIGIAVAHRTADSRADLGVVDGLGRVCALIIDEVSLFAKHLDEMLFQIEPGVIGTNGNSLHIRLICFWSAHGARVYASTIVRMLSTSVVGEHGF